MMTTDVEPKESKELEFREMTKEQQRNWIRSNAFKSPAELTLKLLDIICDQTDHLEEVGERLRVTEGEVSSLEDRVEAFETNEIDTEDFVKHEEFSFDLNSVLLDSDEDVMKHSELDFDTSDVASNSDLETLGDRLSVFIDGTMDNVARLDKQISESTSFEETIAFLAKVKELKQKHPDVFDVL